MMMYLKNNSMLLGLSVVATLLVVTSCVHWRQSWATWQPPQPVKIEVEGECKAIFNMFPSYWTWGSGLAQDKTGGMFLRDGDIILSNENLLFVYRRSDGPVLKIKLDKWRTLLAGKVVSVSVEEGEEGWEWLEKAQAQDLAALRFLSVGLVEPARLPTLKRLAAANPNVGLMLSPKSDLLQVLPLFKPHALILAERNLDAHGRKLLAGQKKLDTLFFDCMERGCFDFLPELPNLRRLVIANWNAETAGPLPKGLKGLRSLVVLMGKAVSVSDLLPGGTAGLEELSILNRNSVSDIIELAKLQRLKAVILNYCNKVPEFSDLSDLKELRWLGLPPEVSQEQFEAVVKAHPDLKVLEMIQCENIRDLGPLRELKDLEGLVLVGSYKDLDVLQGMKSLRFVGISDEKVADSPERVALIQKALPDALVVPAVPFCLGSGWILALFPAVTLVWILRSRRRRWVLNVSEAEPRQDRGRPLIEALIASAGMVLFAVFAHQGLPWIMLAAVGLLATAVAIERSFHSTSRLLAILGLSGFSLRVVLFVPVGFALGAGLAVLCRISYGIRPLPGGALQPFVAMACLIGATEELLYRGWMQGRVRKLGWPAAVVLAAVAHAAYKTALFVWPPTPIDMVYSFLGLWTAVGGMMFGLLRESSGSVVAPMVGHAAFDLVFYGAVAQAPWWVWT